jgi:hypothetical protein
MAKTAALVPVDHIARSILVLRGHKVLLDAELAELYGVATKVLLQAMKRNRERFPEDFMIQLTPEEWAALRSQVVTLKPARGQHDHPRNTRDGRYPWTRRKTAGTR